MHLVVARLVSMTVIFLTTSNIEILVHYLFSRHQWTACVRAVRDVRQKCSKIYTVSQKSSHFGIPSNFEQILTDFQNSFTGAFCGKFAIRRLLNIPPHLNCVAKLSVYILSSSSSSASSAWRVAISRSLPPLRSFARTVCPPLAAGPQSSGSVAVTPVKYKNIFKNHYN